MREKFKELCDLISDLMKGEFYGSLTINFQSGKIVNVEKNESIKL